MYVCTCVCRDLSVCLVGMMVGAKHVEVVRNDVVVGPGFVTIRLFQSLCNLLYLYRPCPVCE